MKNVQNSVYRAAAFLRRNPIIVAVLIGLLCLATMAPPRVIS